MPIQVIDEFGTRTLSGLRATDNQSTKDIKVALARNRSNNSMQNDYEWQTVFPTQITNFDNYVQSNEYGRYPPELGGPGGEGSHWVITINQWNVTFRDTGKIFHIVWAYNFSGTWEQCDLIAEWNGNTLIKTTGPNTPASGSSLFSPQNATLSLDGRSLQWNSCNTLTGLRTTPLVARWYDK